MVRDKFKVGDVVYALPESNSHYSCTNHRHGWKGEVTAISGGQFNASTIKGEASCEGEQYYGLSQELFKCNTPNKRSFAQIRKDHWKDLKS